MKTENLTLKQLSAAYEAICEEYAKRLCIQFEIDQDYWWIADRIGEALMFGDYCLDFDNVKLLVDNAVPFDTFAEWWDASVLSDDKYKASVSLRVWLEGYRPEEK